MISDKSMRFKKTRQPDFSLPSILAVFATGPWSLGKPAGHRGLHDCRHRNMVIGRHQLGPSCDQGLFSGPGRIYTLDRPGCWFSGKEETKENKGASIREERNKCVPVMTVIAALRFPGVGL